MRRWLGILAVVGLMLGCAGVWDDVADFFDSGFADDDNGGEDTDDTDPVIDYEIIDTDTVELTEEDRTKRVQVVLAPDETTTTLTVLTIRDGTDDGKFTATRPTVVSYDLTITETQFTTMIERSSGSPTTIRETYEILADEQQIRLTEEGATDATVVDAALSSDGDRLTLTYPEDAGGGRAVFDRVGEGDEDDELTTENLEGSWELDLEASDIDDVTRLTEDNLAGTWNVSGDLPDGFLSEFGAEIASATAVRIDQNTFTFQTDEDDDQIPDDEDTIP